MGILTQMFQLYIKNNSWKIEVIISTLKLAFSPGMLTSVNSTCISLVPEASNIKSSTLSIYLL